MKLRTLLIAIFFTIIANVSYGQVSIITKPFTRILKKVSNKVSNKLSKNSIQYLAEHGPKNYISKEISLVSRTNKMISVDFSDKIISRNYLVFKFFTKDVDKIGTKYIIKGIKNIERENLEYILKKGYSKFYIKEIRRLRIKNKFFLDAGIDNISKKINRINILKCNKLQQVKELRSLGLNIRHFNKFGIDFISNQKNYKTLIRDLENNLKNKKLIKWFSEDSNRILAYKQLSETAPTLRINLKNLDKVAKQIKEGKSSFHINIANSVGKNNIGKILKYGVEYKEKIIKVGKINIKGVFPDFSKYNIANGIKLDKTLYRASDGKQFAAAKEMFKKQYLQNKEEVIIMLKKHNARMVKEGRVNILNGKTLNAKEMLERQIRDIEGNNNKIFGFIWHHNENPGVMNLVAQDVHEFHKHTGGKIIWNGGGVNR